MLDLRRLRLLHELHRRGTVGAVADALSYSPSTVSQQLGVLEREAGTALFEPAGRRLRLTDAALVLVAHTESLLAGVERAEADLAAAAAGAVRGIVRVGSFQTASLHLLLPAMAELRGTHPDVEVQVVEVETESALEGLRSHAIDLALADEWSGSPRPAHPSVERVDLFTEPVQLILPEDHPAAAGGRPVALASLADAAWAVGYEGGGMAELVRRICAEHGGFEPDVRHRTNELSMLVGLVAQGHAVTLLPALALRGVPSTVAVRAVAGADLSRTVFTATRTGAGHRPALAAVLAAIGRGVPTSPSSRRGSGRRSARRGRRAA